ncbi:hypothetical protein KAJ27_09035, partial [bacterium]|nr:hypothetical protein [bacterium]
MIPIILIFLLLVVVLVITFIKLSTPKKVTKVQSPINKEATKLIEQAHAEKDAGNLQAYLNILSQANLKDPHNNEIKIELADAYNDAGLFSKAKLGYENYLKTEQNETNILEVLKKIFTIEDDAGNTRNVFLTALKIIVLNPADKNYYNILGLILGAHGKHDDAIGYLNKVIEMDPKDKKAYFYRGLVFAAREWKNEAAKEFEMAVNNGCEDVRASFLCGLMIRDTDKEKAIEYYLKAFDMMQKILT